MEDGDFNVKCPICNNNVDLVATSEDTKLTPTSVYGITKQAQEQLIVNIGEALKIPTVGLRYQNVYGPGQSLKNPYTGILSIFSTRIKNNKPVNIFEDGKESRDFVYIDDVINATLLAIEKDEANNQVFNVGTGRAISVIELVELLYKEYHETPNYSISANFRIGDIAHNYADLEKINTLLSFKPTVPFEEGIKHFAAWVNKQEVQKDNFDASIEEMKKKGLFK
jgi:dTDP-L-rhamnose 4-epimerase